MERHFTSASSPFYMSGDGEPEDIIDVIGDKRARTILGAINDEPQSAKELANSHDLSLATVYRRIELLERHDLVEYKTVIGDDGNHYKIYESTLDSIIIRLENDTYDTQVVQKDGLSTKFAQLWSELRSR